MILLTDKELAEIRERFKAWNNTGAVSRYWGDIGLLLDFADELQRMVTAQKKEAVELDDCYARARNRELELATQVEDLRTQLAEVLPVANARYRDKDAPRWMCPKCHGDALPTWNENDMLTLTCNCGYSWATDSLDAAPPKGEPDTHSPEHDAGPPWTITQEELDKLGISETFGGDVSKPDTTQGVTATIDAYIREHGGNTRDALNWALGELQAARDKAQIWEDIAKGEPDTQDADHELAEMVRAMPNKGCLRRFDDYWIASPTPGDNEDYQDTPEAALRAAREKQARK
jgi:hypothetical protein